jgi:hypothetical protein
VVETTQRLQGSGKGTTGVQSRSVFVEGGTMTKKQLLEDIKADASRFFRAPGDVLRDRRFSDQERLEILYAWECKANAVNDEGHDPNVPNAIVTARAEVERKLAGGVEPQKIGTIS